jgi:hypothetical protein
MSSSSNVDPMKKSSIYATFGRYYGEKLYKLLFDCCSGLPGSFCYEVLKCLNISPQGNADLVLNQQGEWISLNTLSLQIPEYTNDAAADADTNLPSGALYKVELSRIVYQKP